MAELMVGLLLLNGALFFSIVSAYVISNHLVSRNSLAFRAGAAVTLHAWLLLFVFHILSPFSAFRVLIAFPVLLVAGLMILGVFLRREAVVRLARQDNDRLRTFLKEGLRSRWMFLAAPLLLVALGILLRELVAPPLGWDALTYHLARPARWVQVGGMVQSVAPGSTFYYDFFPSGGEIFWAWGLLAGHGDGLLVFSSIWAACVSVVLLFATARTCGITRKRSALFALFVLTLPAVLFPLTSHYVDTLHAAFLLFGLSVIVSELKRREGTGNLLVAAASLGIAASIKATTVPFLVAAVPVMAWALLTGPEPPRRRLLLALSAGAMLLIGAPDYIRAWLITGSPLYPIGMSFGPFGSLPGNEEFMAVHTGALWPDAPHLTADGLFAYLYVFTREGWNHLNFGFGGLTLSLAGAIGLVSRGWQKEHRSAGALLVGILLFGILMYLSPTAGVYRLELWAPVFGRLFLAQMAALALAAVLLLPDRLGWVIAVALSLNLWQSIPAGWGEADAQSLIRLWPYFLGGLIVCIGGMWVWTVSGKLLPAAGGMLAGFVIVVAPLSPLRQDMRYTYYEESSLGPDGVFFADQLEPHFASAWPLWKYLDTDTSQTVAIAAGWDGFGQNWYWYPFFGSRLQNHPLYVPITEDGSLVDYRLQEEVSRRSSRPAWLRRLREKNVDYLAALVLAPEMDWADQTPEVFQRVAVSGDAINVLYRIDQSAIDSLLMKE